MTELLRRFGFYRGVGSAIDVLPSTDYLDYVELLSDEEIIRRSFEVAGKHIEEATKNYEGQYREFTSVSRERESYRQDSRRTFEAR